MREHREHRAQVLCSTTQPRWSLLFLSGGEPRQTEGYKHNKLKELNAPFVYMHVMLRAEMSGWLRGREVLALTWKFHGRDMEGSSTGSEGGAESEAAE